MAMSYDTLVGPKGATGSLLNWIGYGKVDITTVLDEAQFLLWDLGLRLREMRTEFVFGMVQGQANVPLPPRFLDPIGRVYDVTNVTDYDQVNLTDVLASRSYDSSFAGNFGAGPFTTTAGSSLVSVHFANHGFSQDSTITIAGATSANGLNFNGTSPIITITDVNDFVIDTGDMNSGATATASGADGGAAATYTGNNLVQGSPTRWAIWNEQIKFDAALNQPAAMKLPYFRQPVLLSVTNETNFLTSRYPRLLRTACTASAADYMKDTDEYNKLVQQLTSLIQATMANDDLSYRGATIGTDTP